MALARAFAVALTGVTGHLVAVEADLAAGLPNANVLGIGDTAGKQASFRIRAAVVNSGQKWPERRITLALSPAAMPKRGAGFDLALAGAVLAAAQVVPAGPTEGLVMIGELGLDGTVRPVSGVLPALLAARAGGKTEAIVPAGNVAEAALAEGMRVRGVEHLTALIGHLRGEPDRLITPGRPALLDTDAGPDLADVLGQPEGRRALELAAAGGHHLAMFGPPGAGKTMLASRLPSLLPALDPEAALEVTAIHSVAGRLDEQIPLITRPQLSDPHHSATLAAIVGGGSGMLRPGEASLAHRGVLFLDEAPEFKPTVLDALRQPMESGQVLIARANGSVRFPARFQLVLAANPCPCAAAADVDCTCGPGVRRRYQARLSGPLLDRVDIRLDLPPLRPEALLADKPAENSDVVRARVTRARLAAARRWAQWGSATNAEVPGSVLRRTWRPRDAELRLLDQAVRTGRLTGRGYDRVVRLAFTSADLADRAMPDRRDLATALALRCPEVAA